jgi:hypothetical protein
VAIFVECVGKLHGIDTYLWPYSLADIARAVRVMLRPDLSESGAELPREAAGDIDPFAMSGLRGADLRSCSIVPIIVSVKHTIASGLPVLAAFAPPIAVVQATSASILQIHREEADELRPRVEVVPLIGWDDTDASFIYRHMDCGQYQEELLGNVTYTDLMSPANRIELIALSTSNGSEV